MNSAISERYRCPEEFIRSRVDAPLTDQKEFFRFNTEILCYGRHSGLARNGSAGDLFGAVGSKEGVLALPFDPTEIIGNLRHESYMVNGSGPAGGRLLNVLYYLARPLLPHPIRRLLQRIYFSGWQKIPFPRWPVDVTVEDLLEQLLLLFLKTSGIDSIPFIWFWPDGAPSAAIVTHDVETSAGREFCDELMALDESFGVPASFQIVPEERYAVTPEFLDKLRARGHEINVQDLNHDGRLFRDQSQFEARVKAINASGRSFGARGFRSAVLYRNVNWFHLLEFDYDMSVPNVGHLEAQRGGCCTVFPYFIGDILEIPVTTTQDYTLFHMLRRYDLDLWNSQITAVTKKHGLVSMIVHPDYVVEHRARKTYQHLLEVLDRQRAEQGMWITSPGEINDWWRERSQMKLVHRDGSWRIEGRGKERARIAFAKADAGRLAYNFSS